VTASTFRTAGLKKPWNSSPDWQIRPQALVKGSAVNESAQRALIVQVLREPERLRALDAAQWTLLVRQARRSDLLARVASLADDVGARPSLEAQVGAHLDDVLMLAKAQAAEVRREVEFLARALTPLGIPVTLMKGAAYLMSGRRAALGRLFSDIDIMVPKARIGEVEAALMLNGWAGSHHTPYDQRYYREWMHEIPPMQHIHRGTTLDVHHAILPETARLKPNSALILAAATPLADDARIQVLSPHDMVLHSMTHLFHNEELSHGLRDLSDLDLLMREFGGEPTFWPGLVERARQLDLARPLFYGLRYTRHFFATPVPEQSIAALAPFGPRQPLAGLMDRLWARGLAPQHATVAQPYAAAALFALYVRAHWLRMPPLLLARHLATKALRTPKSEPSRAQ
jgi:Uncharacterised nucleotidyltransferase